MNTGLFGFSVASAGDVNKDGYADIIVGAYQNQGALGAASKGAAYIFYGSAAGITTHILNGTAYTCSGPPDCTVIQNPDNEPSGFFSYSVASAGDVNKDGYADVIVGAYQNQGTLGAANKGAAYIFYGSAAGITTHILNGTAYTCSGPPDCTVIQNPDDEPSGFFGESVASAGDVNMDGYADVIVGAAQNQGTLGVANKGAAYIFYGSAAGITTHVLNATLYNCSGPPDCTVIQNPDNENSGFFGDAAAGAGDINKDGYEDIIVGAPQNQGTLGAANKGAAYIFYGSAAGITTHVLNGTPYNCFGPPDCTVIQNPDNETPGPGFGDAVGAAGDVNWDGYADIIVGAPRNQGTGAADKGAAYIFYGSASGITTHILNATPYTCSGPPDCTVIQNPDNETPGPGFGIAVASTGDVNRDGYADIIVGAAKNQGAGAGDKGAAYIFYGSSSGITTHILNVTPYNCSGPPDCTVIQNPDNETSGGFGRGVGFLAPTLRRAPAILDVPTPRRSSFTTAAPEEYALLRREEDIA